MSEERSIPEQLRQARAQQQKSIAEVHRQSGISAAVLQGLEGGNFEVVEPIFMRLGLRAYAQYLGLDVAAILQVYDQDFVPPPPPPPEPAQTAPSAPVLPFSISPQIRLIGLAAAGLVVLILVLVALLSDDEPDPAATATRTRSSAEVAKRPVSIRNHSGDQTQPRTAPVGSAAATSLQRAESSPRPAPGTETSSPGTEPAPPPQAQTRMPAPGQATAPAATTPAEPAERQSPDVSEPTATDRPPQATATATTAAEPTELQSPADPEPTATDQPVEEGAAAEPAELQSPADPEPTATDQPVEEGAERTAAPAEPALPAETATTPAVPANDDSLLVLKIEALEEVWVKIEGDGHILLEQTVAAGFASQDLQARSYFQVTAGKPRGLRYWFQGELLGENGRLGDPNRVLHFRASKEGVVLLRRNPWTAASRDTLP